MPRTMIAALVACLALPCAGHAKAVSQVGQCKGNTVLHFTTIGAALAAQSSAGSTIYLCPNVYAEQLTITNPTNLIGVNDGTSSGAILTAPASGLVANAPGSDPNVPYAAQIAVIGAGTVTISNVTVDGTNNQIDGCAPILVGILYQNTSGTVQNSRVINQALVNGQNGLGGCQSGNAIELLGSGSQTVNVVGNDVTGFQKNGITVDSVVATITGNTVTGQGATSAIAQNGIETDSSPGVLISQNVVSDLVYTGQYGGATGILIYDSAQAQVKSNTGTNTQGVIYDFADETGASDAPTITSNRIQATHTFDGIDVCGVGSAVISGNTVNGSDESAVHLDSECVAYNSDGSTTRLYSSATVSNTKVNGACVGILVGSGSTLSSKSGTNSLFSTISNTLLGSDTCPGTAPQFAVHAGGRKAKRVAPLR